MGGNLCTSREQCGWIVGQPFVARAGNGIPPVVFLIAKALLNDDRVHAQAVHAANLLPPVGFSQLPDRRIPRTAFLVAPMCDANPGAIDGTSRTNLRG